MPPSEAELRQHNIHGSAFVENADQCKSGLAEKYVIIVQDMYDDSTTAVRCAVGVTEGFEVKVGAASRIGFEPLFVCNDDG